jgi:hypothetical protein
VVLAVLWKTELRHNRTNHQPTTNNQQLPGLNSNSWRLIFASVANLTLIDLLRWVSVGRKEPFLTHDDSHRNKSNKKGYIWQLQPWQ